MDRYARSYRLTRVLPLIIVLVLMIGEIGSTAVAQTLPAVDRPAVAATERILQDDVLEIRIAGQSHDKVRIVDETGILNFPFVEKPVVAACKTATQLAEELTEAYRKYLIDPRVTVVIRDQPSRLVLLTGAVRQATRFDLRRSTSISELISLAGGVTDLFSGTITAARAAGWSCENDQVRRHGALYAVLNATGGTAIVPADFQILPGMRLEFGQKPAVMVVGNVDRPQTLPFTPQMTVTEAIARAGGALRETRKEKVRILRAQPGILERQAIWVDLTKIEQGKAQDILLVSNDVVVVPSRQDPDGLSPHASVPQVLADMPPLIAID